MMRQQILMFLTATSLALSMSPVMADSALEAANLAMQRKEYPMAVRLLTPLADAGVAGAQLRLGLLYYHGHGVRESDALAQQWFERAAVQGLAEAQFQLANLHAYGLSTVPADTDPLRLAAQWYHEAAAQGHAQAQYSLGILFLTGSGVVASPERARQWIARAAAQGHADARAFLAGEQAR